MTFPFRFLLFFTIIFLTQNYSVSAQQWEKLNKTPFLTHHTNGFGYDGKAYLIEGQISEAGFNQLWIYTPGEESWDPVSNFPGAARTIAIGDDWDDKYYYGFGRNADNERLSDLWVFDPEDSSWYQFPDCPCEGRLHPALVAHNDKILMGAGSGDDGNMKDWWEFDIATEIWTQKEDIPGATRHHPYMFSIDSIAYVGGGHVDNWNAYNMNQETWSSIDNLPGGRVAGTQLQYGNRGIILAGDQADHSDLPYEESFMTYNVESEEWEYMPPIPDGSRWAPSSFIIDEYLYFFNGLSGQESDSLMWRFDLSNLDCQPPNNLNTVSTTKNSAGIIWSNASDVTSDTLIWRKVGEEEWNVIENPQSLYVINGLDSCTRYEYVLLQECGDLFASSEPIVFKTKGDCCDNPDTFSTGPFDTFEDAADCVTNPMTADFQVWSNEAYYIESLDQGGYYYFSMCDGYDASLWESQITIYTYHRVSGKLGQWVAGAIDCELQFQFSYSEQYPDVLIIISDANDCEGTTVEVDNGTPSFGCLNTDEDNDGFVELEDCDDTNADINPDAEEIANNDIDENCDGIILVIDEDSDGYNSDEDCDDTNSGINPDAEEVANNDIDENCDGIVLVIDEDSDGYNSDQDCDDTNADINPDAEEVANNDIDENCDGIVLVVDEDNDGYNSDEDCDDTNANINPDAEEIANNDIDENCDGIILVIDDDGDGYNSDEDCDDTNADINPDAEEIAYNGLDDDCDTATLDDDLDEDGFNNDIDCDDMNADINPDAEEMANNDIDENCDGIVLVIDDDGDGYNSDEDCDDMNADINPDAEEIENNDIDENCDGIVLVIDDDGDGYNSDEDCDDTNADINPDAEELVYNGLDDDCDTSTLDDDLDEDGFGIDEDCDDTNASIYPGAEEVANNGIDEDCDGLDLSTATHELGSLMIDVLPNPATNFFIINLNQATLIDYQLVDITGKKVLNGQSKSIQTRLDVSSLSSGVYILQLSDRHGNMVSEKLIIE